MTGGLKNGETSSSNVVFKLISKKIKTLFSNSNKKLRKVIDISWPRIDSNPCNKGTPVIQFFVKLNMKLSQY